MEKIICGLIVMFSVCIQSGFAIQCYDCNSHYNTSCSGLNGEQINAEYKINCNLTMPRATLCRKILQYIDFEENGMGPDTRVIRQCGIDESNEKGYYYRTGYGGKVEVYTCWENEDSEACNTATNRILNVNTHVLAVFSLVSVILAKIL